MMKEAKVPDSSAKIFVVEDERIIAKDIETTLKSLGYHYVGGALSGEDALEKIPLLSPDLVLMDINLKGGINGVETAEQLKTLMDVPVVYLTAYSDEKTLEKAKRTEPYGYILKPFEERELHSIIEMALYKHKIEKQLKYNERWYKSILNSIGEGVIATDQQGQITFINPKAQDMTGFKEAEAVGKHVDTVFRIGKEKQSDKVASPVTLLLETRKSQLSTEQISLVSKGKKQLPIDYLATFIMNSNDEPEGAILVFRDISDRVISARALQATENKYLTVFETARDIIYTLSVDGKITSLNRAYEELTGFRKDFMIGKSYLSFIHPDDIPVAAQSFNMLLQGESPPAHELRIRTIDDKYKYVEITSVSEKENGQVISTIGIARDITTRKEAEQELIKAKNLAEQSKKYQEQFLANISHEIRTPMNAIMGMSQLLLRSQLGKEQVEFINSIKLSADNLLVIINDILDISKIQAGKMTFEESPFNLHEMMNGLYNTMKFKVSEKKLKFSTIMDHAIFPYLVGDQVRLNQILLNLLGNAVKFTEKGGVKIECNLLSGNDEFEEISFRVSDTGIGIPPEKFDIIFDNFKQASSDTTRKYGGTGLGLTISKQLVEMQGGSITVDSTEGVGSVFTVKMKFKRGTLPAEQKVQVEEQNLVLGPVRVLVVEDNTFNKLLMKNVLYSWKAQVDIADNGQIGVDMLRDNDYDIILMDIQMPVMDGYEATRFIREQMPEPKSKTPIIAVTAHATISEHEKCIKAGMNDYVSKPVSIDKLYRKMKNILRGDGSEAIATAEEENLLEIKEQLTDISYIESIAGGSKEMMVEMINIFIHETPEMLDGMKKAIEEADWKMFREVAHKIKPSLNYVGIQKVEEDIARMHDYAKQQSNLEDIEKIFPGFDNTCKAAIEELKQKVAELQATA